MAGSDELAILLGLISAVTLAVSNVAVKRSADILVGRVVMAVWGAVILIPFAFIVPLPSPETWRALAVGLMAHFAYQACLVRALHRGDLSLVFPVMRGLSPLMAGLFAWLVLGETLSPVGILGLIIAAAAVIYFGKPEGGASFRSHPNFWALFWAAGTAIGIALYSVADANGVRTADNPATYIVWLFLLDPLGMTSVAIVTRGRSLIASIAEKWRYGVVAGTLSVLSFGSALYAMDMIEVARVSALRETGVVFAALLAWLFLKEGFGLRRTLAAALLTFGLILLQLSA